MQKAGVPISSVHHVPSGGELAGTLDRVLADGHDLVVVGGGDGTVSYAAGRVAGTNVMLGVLPLGTANDFARTLEIPNNLAEACVTSQKGRWWTSTSAGLTVSHSSTSRPWACRCL